MTSDRVYRQGKPYEAASEELDRFAESQFDPEAVVAFHRVPREDWDDLRRRSLIKKQGEPVSSAGRTLASLLNEKMAAIAS